MRHEFPNPGPLNAELRMAGGILDVVAGDGDTVVVTVEPLDGSESTAEAAKEVKVALSGSHLIVHTPEKAGWRFFWRAKLHVHVQLPAGSTVTVRVASARVTLRGRYRDLVVHSASGDIGIGDAGGDIRVNTASGDVTVGVARRGEVKTQTASGDVRIGIIEGTLIWLDLNTMSGSTSSDLARGPGQGTPAEGAALTVKARTLSGDISLRRVVTA